jgi:hypothetical protein
VLDERPRTQYAASSAGIEHAERAEVSVGEPGVLAPAPANARSNDSEPPTAVTMMNDGMPGGFSEDEPPSGVTIMALAPSFDRPSAAPVSEGEAHSSAPPKRRSQPPVPADVGERLTELAKEALLDQDARSLQRWTEGLLATGERGRFAERMQAIARLTRGDVGDALRVLRTVRAELDPASDAAERCQASLALGVALAAAGRPDEALLEALDALARAREIGDEKGSLACLAFLAKLYASVSRVDDAEKLRAAAKIAPPAPPAPVPDKAAPARTTTTTT